MADKLTSLREVTTVVADTGNISEIKLYRPQDATTNPSIILGAATLPEYKDLIKKAVSHGRAYPGDRKEKIRQAVDKLNVGIGLEILKEIPGRISTEIDAHLSYDTEASIKKALSLIKLYNEAGIGNDRVLIKLAATWQGIRAAEKLEEAGINCNLTLLFSFAQARACAEANVYLISPFVGRILDWYKQKNQVTYSPSEDPGVLSVTTIYNYYKQHGYDTIVMGASFRNLDQIHELAGCDRLTISPKLLNELSKMHGVIDRKLLYSGQLKAKPNKMTESQFSWEHNRNPMAVEKLAQGIRDFASDQEKLNEMIAQLL
jgi:transaldolase